MTASNKKQRRKPQARARPDQEQAAAQQLPTAANEPIHRSPGSPVRPDVTRLAKLEGFFGGTGTGKSTSVKQRLLQLDRRVPIVIFDPKHEYPANAAGASEQHFFAAVNGMANKHAPVRWAVLQPPFDHERRGRMFNRFCRIALAIAQQCGGVIVVVDELHLVTGSTPGTAPAGWNELVNTGRAWGVHILAASIRPQSIDMEFRSNLTYIRSGRLGERADCERVASKLMVPWEDIAALPNLEFFERDMIDGTPARKGRITF